MISIAVIGANGQVGSEVTLRLLGAGSFNVVPIVRNVRGSAYLRSLGVEVVHADAANPSQLKEVTRDCDAIINLAHVESYLPSQRSINGRIVDALAHGTPPGIPIVICSTIMVYAPGLRIRVPDSYGMEKRLLERRAKRQIGKERLFIFRLGHVLGALQGISRKIDAEIAAGPVAMVDEGNRASNAVFAASVAEAVARVAQGGVRSDCYDLQNSPSLSWAEVYAIHAERLGLPLSILDSGRSVTSLRDAAMVAPRKTMNLLMQQSVRERAGFLLRYLPESVAEKAHAKYQIKRASREIRALSAPGESVVQPWRQVGVNPFPLNDWSSAERAYPLLRQ